jgi:hypothetical protein
VRHATTPSSVTTRLTLKESDESAHHTADAVVVVDASVKELDEH